MLLTEWNWDDAKRVWTEEGAQQRTLEIFEFLTKGHSFSQILQKDKKTRQNLKNIYYFQHKFLHKFREKQIGNEQTIQRQRFYEIIRRQG